MPATESDWLEYSAPLTLVKVLNVQVLKAGSGSMENYKDESGWSVQNFSGMKLFGIFLTICSSRKITWLVFSDVVSFWYSSDFSYQYCSYMPQYFDFGAPVQSYFKHANYHLRWNAIWQPVFYGRLYVYLKIFKNWPIDF